jgi:hypothetical protein
MNLMLLIQPDKDVFLTNAVKYGIKTLNVFKHILFTVP